MPFTDPFIDPTVTALLVIDMQKGFCDPESQMEKAGIGTANQRAVLPDILRGGAGGRRPGLPGLGAQPHHNPPPQVLEPPTPRHRGAHPPKGGGC